MDRDSDRLEAAMRQQHPTGGHGTAGIVAREYTDPGGAGLQPPAAESTDSTSHRLGVNRGAGWWVHPVPGLNPSPSEVEWSRLVAELARSPILYTRLLDEHQQDGRGYCRTCTTGGQGSRLTPFPCGIYAVAEAARDHIR